MRLPSLNALRAFEAAARHESFARAANELCVTEGAVSRHIKLLEEDLGVTLFRRLTRKVELTAEGRQLLTVVGGAFSDIASGAARIASHKSDLKVVSAHTFSIRWLVPRLERFHARNPEFRLQLTTKVYQWDDLLTDEYDLGFACTLAEKPKGLKAVPFLPLSLTPACSPSYLAQLPEPRRPEDLAKVTLLHTGIDHGDWQLWAGAFGNGMIDVSGGVSFSDRDSAFRAAVMGLGVVIGDLTFIQEELASGALVTPFADLICREASADYHIICRDEAWNDPRVRVLYEWLTEERDSDPCCTRQIAAAAFAAE